MLALLILLVIIIAFTYEKFTQPLILEVADTPQLRANGLMHRDLMASHGMLFIYPKKGIHKMWMKNTRMPLDLIYLSDDFKVIGVVKNLRPYSLEVRGLDIPTRYIIEVNAGSTFKVGDDLRSSIPSNRYNILSII